MNYFLQISIFVFCTRCLPCASEEKKATVIGCLPCASEEKRARVIGATLGKTFSMLKGFSDIEIWGSGVYVPPSKALISEVWYFQDLNGYHGIKTTVGLYQIGYLEPTNIENPSKNWIREAEYLLGFYPAWVLSEASWNYKNYLRVEFGPFVGARLNKYTSFVWGFFMGLIWDYRLSDKNYLGSIPSLYRLAKYPPNAGPISEARFCF